MNKRVRNKRRKVMSSQKKKIRARRMRTMMTLSVILKTSNQRSYNLIMRETIWISGILLRIKVPPRPVLRSSMMRIFYLTISTKKLDKLQLSVLIL
jgi:hypothetical protein